MNLKTSLQYDFSAHVFSTDEQLSIIRKHEKMGILTGSCDIVVTCDSTGDIWYKISFYLNNKPVEFQLADKILYLTIEGYTLIRDAYNTSENPFYNHPVYFILDNLANHPVKMTLSDSVNYVVMIYNVLTTMVNNYSQWVNQV